MCHLYMWEFGNCFHGNWFHLVITWHCIMVCVPPYCNQPCLQLYHGILMNLICDHIEAASSNCSISPEGYFTYIGDSFMYTKVRLWFKAKIIVLKKKTLMKFYSRAKI